MPPLTGLDFQQQTAVLAPRGPLCVLAGAGTGKTRTITRRIAHLIDSGQVNPAHVLSVTFTARAAAEMRNRLTALGCGGPGNTVQAQTFHAAALRQLRYFWPRAFGNQQWHLLDRKMPAIAQAARRAGIDDDALVGPLAAEIEWAKAALIGPTAYPESIANHRRTLPTTAELIAQVYHNYETSKLSTDQWTLDFDDILIFTAQILHDREDIAEEFRAQYRTFVVDEYQDVTPAQQGLLNAWLGERDDLTVVGDANQTIYSFTGATPTFLLDFSRRFPEATLIRLEQDYRSTPQVVDLANTVIGGAVGRIAGTRLDLIGQRAPGPTPTLTECDTDADEANTVATKIDALIAAGTSPDQIAVLYRTNAQAHVHQKALDIHGIAFRVTDDTKRPPRATHAAAPDESIPAVTLSTLHAAKGLEWEAVFLIGLAEGLLPSIQAINGTPADVEEERRLLYVGVTRAGQQLQLSWARSRGTNTRSRRRSRFLDNLAITVLKPAEERNLQRRDVANNPPNLDK